MFDFDPIGDYITRRKGKYNLNNGNFTSTDTFKNGYWAEQRLVEGYGTIADNGNLDLLFTNKLTDVLGVVSAYLVRMERTKCDGTTTVWAIDPEATVDQDAPTDSDPIIETVEINSPTKVTAHYEEELSYGWYYQDTVYTPDNDAEITIDYANGAYTSNTTWKWDGTGRESWAQLGEPFGGDVDYEGVIRSAFNGSWTEEYTGYDAGTDNVAFTVSLAISYDQSGTGSYTIGGDYACDLSFQAGGACYYECPDQTGDCTGWFF